VIDRATDILVLRPLITTGKIDIIQTATAIGTEPFAARMPEYCGVISVKPTTRAKLPKVEYEEKKFDFGIVEQALANARYITIDEVANDNPEGPEVDVLTAPVVGSVIIDVRHPADRERKPLRAGNIGIEKIPFYELQDRFRALDPDITYLLYCEKGVMSKLHAAHLAERGFRNVKVYRPA
jgi:thiamine biosynthesis protein ThiI